MDFAFAPDSLQAVIVSRNEQHYRFFQYKADGNYGITRPINSNLLIDAANSKRLSEDFLTAMGSVRDIAPEDTDTRLLICNSIYTVQQSIGATLDALPAGESNKARKINGDLFERLIKLLIQRLGVNCTSGNISVPVMLDNVEQFRMNYQHDLIIRDGEVVKIIGGVKTSSKDRIDKIFLDKFLYCQLTGTTVPHIAIFLNDVQRKKAAQPNQFGINATFLPGHFKAYTIKLSPLDGVYYCDIRPNMRTDPLLSQHIRTIDHFFCSDLWRLMEQVQGDPNATVEEAEDDTS
ncbi:MAG: hypothetical protein ACLQMO_02695 [Acidobacteriaceae bacterium]